VTTTTGSTTFTLGVGAVAVDNGLTVTDVDNTTLTSATYQTILRSVTYSNSSATPNTATRTVSFVGNDGSLASAPATKDITFAATTTVVSIVQAGASPTNASTVAYTVTFANTVTGVNTSNFTVNSTNLTGASVASVAESGASYTVTVNTGTLSPGTTGSVQLQFANSTGISPVVTNPGLTGPAYVIDRAAPTTTISSSAGASGSSTGTAPIPFTVTFSESVLGFSAADITVSNGAPTITGGTAATRNLSINSGASLRMSDGMLDVRGSWTNNSSFVATGGTVVLGTSTLGTIVGSGTTRFWSLRVESSGALLATSAGATVQQVLTLNGGFSTNGNSFTLLSNATGTALVVNSGGV
nr:hypothetical protein [Tanacetum cinerariifolium]